MKNSTWAQKEIVIDILTKSFDDNQSVNYIIKQDKTRQKRIKALIDYSYEVCSRFGEVILSEDRTTCALILYPDKKQTTIQSVLLDVKLIFLSIGLRNIKKVLNRESLIKNTQPKELMTYLWFIGVEPKEQHKGNGSRLLKSILDESAQMNRIICLETSTLKNLPWYQKFGFDVYDKMNIGYTLYFLRKDFKK